MVACSQERKYFVDSAKDETHHRGAETRENLTLYLRVLCAPW